MAHVWEERLGGKRGIEVLQRVTDEMFIAAPKAVAAQVTEAELYPSLRYPLQSDILQTDITTTSGI